MTAIDSLPPKRCIKCDIEKPISDFYPTTRNKTGFMGMCKKCHNLQVNARQRVRAIEDPEWGEKQLERHRIKARRNAKPKTAEQVKRRDIQYANRHPEKVAAKTAVRAAIRHGRLLRQPCEVCGCNEVDAHHEDYSKPLEVRWLCRRHHAERHVEINRQRRLANLALCRS